ncbi:hypothetical protein RB594_006242 [Gaeumannomyces avenae]
MSGNQALNDNMSIGQTANVAITDHGSDWYFTVAAVMAASALAFTGLSVTKPTAHRVFHQTAALFCFVAAIGYWTMGSGLGDIPTVVEFARPDSAMVSGAGPGGTRQIFYVRYIDWAVSSPLVVLALLLSSGAPLSTTLTTMLATEIYVVTLLVGALTATAYKFGYLAFGMAAQWFVLYQLLMLGRQHAAAVGGSVSSTYLTATLLTVAVWIFYPIAWGLCEGGNILHPDSEAIFYGILDIFAKPVVGFILVLGHRNTDFASLGFASQEPGPVGEKTTAAAPAGGVSNGGGAA